MSQNFVGTTEVSMIIQNLPDARKDYFDRVVPSLNEKPLVDVSYDSTYNFESLSIDRVTGRYSSSVPSMALTDALDSIAQHQSYGIIEYKLSTWDKGKTGSLGINVRRK